LHKWKSTVYEGIKNTEGVAVSMQINSPGNTQAETTIVRETARSNETQGCAQATLTVQTGEPLPLIFSVGSLGANLGAVRVVIRDEAGIAVATMSLASLTGPQNIIWTPRPGMTAGAFSAYWEAVGQVEPRGLTPPL
jgi:hypothetical protein